MTIEIASINTTEKNMYLMTVTATDNKGNTISISEVKERSEVRHIIGTLDNEISI